MSKSRILFVRNKVNYGIRGGINSDCALGYYGKLCTQCSKELIDG